MYTPGIWEACLVCTPGYMRGILHPGYIPPYTHPGYTYHPVHAVRGGYRCHAAVWRSPGLREGETSAQRAFLASQDLNV